MTVGERIKELRTCRGLSQDDLARAVGTTKQTIYKYEMNMVNNIPLNRLQVIADMLEVEPGHLLGWDDPERERANPVFRVRRTSLSDHEKRLVAAYRKHPEMQKAVDKLLNVYADRNTSEETDDGEVVPVYRAAQSDTRHDDEITLIPSQKIDAWKNLPDEDQPLS